MKKLKMTIGYYTFLLELVALLVNANTCPDNFVSLGRFCYHFSDMEENWNVARGVCGGIGSITNEYVIPAVLDLGSAEDNLLLLSHITYKNPNYWLGGYFEDGMWQWIYNKEENIDLYANYWYGRSTDRNGTCTKTTNSGARTFIQSESCDTKMKVICQIIPDYYGFRDIGNGKFFFSTVNNNTEVTWIEARDACQSLLPPDNFDYVDLATSLDPDTDQQLLKIIAQYDTNVWLGGYAERAKPPTYTRHFKWIDGREINKRTYFMDDNSFESYYDNSDILITYVAIDIYRGRLRANINACMQNAYGGCYRLNFVCQAYKNQTTGTYSKITE